MALQYLYAAGAVMQIGGSIMGGLAGRSAANAEAYQLRMAERQAELEGQNAALDLHRNLRYTQGVALASLGHGRAGIGDSFLAVRSDEFNLYSRDLGNVRLSMLGRAAGFQAGAVAARARGRNELLGGFLDATTAAIGGFRDVKALQPSSEPGGR